MTKTAKITISLVSILLVLLVLFLLKEREVKLSDYYEGVAEVPRELPAAPPEDIAVPGLKMVDQKELMENYQGEMKEKILSIKQDMQSGAFSSEAAQRDLLAMTVPGAFKDLHLSLVRLLMEKEADKTEDLLARVDEIISPYPWLSN